MSQAAQLSTTQLEQAFEAFNRVSTELDTTYKELESKVEGLTRELNGARTARLRELAEKERLAIRLSSLLSALPGGVLILDTRQRICDANPEAIRLVGEPLVGENWYQVLQRATGAEAGNQREFQLSNGKHISVISRLLDQSGEQVVLITDVTEIHALQAQLGHKKRLAALGEMAARLAHQIRTPLSAATLYLSQLSRNDLPASQRQGISSRVNERLNHMSNLLESMLSFVRGESLVMERICLNQMLNSFDASVRPQLEAAGAELLVPEVDDSLVIDGDIDELAGALSNLAINALEAAKNSAHIQLWVGALNHDWLQIRFQDNGPGISEDIADRIFDPFFTTRSQGTGLGLAVVAMVVNQHGGEISVSNHPKGGAEFIINLPIAKQLDQAPEAEGSEEHKSANLESMTLESVVLESVIETEQKDIAHD